VVNGDTHKKHISLQDEVRLTAPCAAPKAISLDERILCQKRSDHTCEYAHALERVHTFQAKYLCLWFKYCIYKCYTCTMDASVS